MRPDRENPRGEPSRFAGSAPGPRVYRNPNGSEARFSPNGRVESVRARGMTIYHNPGGRIEVHRADRAVVVTNDRGHGYIQRPFVYRNTEYVTRTYYVRNTTYVSYYRPYTYQGVTLNVYAPVRYYHPAFYGWVYNPWPSRVYFRWGWFGSPWVGFYSGYWTPAPYYASPVLWLTDYIIAERLAEAYQEQQQANLARQSFNSGQLTPQVKAAISAEVQRQLELENQESQQASRGGAFDPASSGLPRLLRDNQPHVFLVSYNLTVNDVSGNACALGRGDVLALSPSANANSDTVEVQVAASTGRGCPVGTAVWVSMADLQDMNNQLRQSLNQGMGDLHSQAGRNGLPALPAKAAVQPLAAPFAEAAPPPDSNVATELAQQYQEATRVEAEVVGEARSSDPNPPGAPAAPAQPERPTAPPQVVSAGQSTDEVIAILGNPVQILRAGKKEIYRYRDVKVTFVNGKVTDVE